MKMNERTINERLWYLRNRYLRITQTKMGKKIGYDGSTVNKIERGYSTYDENVSDKYIIAVSNAFNVRQTWLRDGTGDVFYKPRKNKIVNDLVDATEPPIEEPKPAADVCCNNNEDSPCSATNVVLGLCKCLTCKSRCPVVDIARQLVRDEDERLVVVNR